MLRWSEFLTPQDNEALQEIKRKENGSHLMRVTQEALWDEQFMWIRKLTELLCDLLLFHSTNEEGYYRLFLTCELLDAYVGLQEDFKEFFNCQNQNAQESIKLFLATVQHCGKSINMKNVWFFRNPINWEKPLKRGLMFASARARYKMALSKADANQKIVLGVSYEKAYATPSRSIHANIGGPVMEVNRKELQGAFSHVILLCGQIILESHKLAGIPLTGDTEFLDKIIRESDPTKALTSVSGKELEVGDIVFAYGKDLCIIVDRSKSCYGYTSYKAKYLTKSPLPEVLEDWYLSSYVHCVLPRKQLREQIMRLFEQHSFPQTAMDRLREMSDQEFDGKLIDFAKKIFEDGGFDHLFKPQPEGQA